MSLSSLRGLQKFHGNAESEDEFISGHKTWKVHRCTAPTNFLRALHLNAYPAVTVLGLRTPPKIAEVDQVKGYPQRSLLT